MRNFQYPIRTLLGVAREPRSFTWACDFWLDQGVEGACTGFSVTQEAGAKPVVVKTVSDKVAKELYLRAKQLDDYPGENYDGSSVLGAVKAAVEKGWYTEYRWAFGIEDLMIAVGYKGPAVLGINWYTGMFDTDADGFLHVTGKIEGGHAILCIGVRVVKNKDGSINYDKSYFLLHNSWGKDWGVNGRGKVSFTDMRRLLAEQGEAVVPVYRKAGLV